MAFTKSTVTTNNISALPNKPLISASALKAKFDQYGSDDKTYVNNLIDELESTTPGSSGAENIGSRTITGITGNTIWAQLQSLYNQIVSVVLGQIPDNSLTNAKLGTDIKIGSNASLQTNVKTDVVSAINEVNAIAKYASFKNRIINGNFGTNQRAVTGTVVLSAGVYGHDRWKAGSAGCTYTFSTLNNVTTITISAGSLVQVIEGVNLQSGTHVLSWQGTAQGKIDAGSYGASGITAIITGGTNAIIEFNIGTLEKVQFEYGSIPTNFEQLHIDFEQQLCERYFEKSYISNFASGNVNAPGSLVFQTRTAISGGGSGQLYPGQFSFKTRKRTTPTVKLYAPVSGTADAVRNTTTNTDRTGATAQLVSDTGVYQIGITNASSNAISLDDVIALHWTADAEL